MALPDALESDIGKITDNLRRVPQTSSINSKPRSIMEDLAAMDEQIARLGQMLDDFRTRLRNTVGA